MLLLLACLISIAFGQYVSISSTDTAKWEYRELVVAKDTYLNSLTAAGLKVQVDKTSNLYQGGASLDLGGFRMRAGGPALNKQEPVVGFSLLSATVSYNWNPTTGVLSTVGAAAWAEVVFGASHICLYKDRNGVNGFQYSVGDPVWNCNDMNGYDCVVFLSCIDLKTDLDWSTLSIGEQSCPAGYSENCTIYTITTTGYSGGVTSGTPVMTITQKLANQKVLISSNNHYFGPDYAKVDFSITYPYSIKGMTTQKANAGIVLAVYAAGKAAVAAREAYFQDHKALVFEAGASSGRSAVLSWDDTATVNNVDTDVVVVHISGSSIKAYNCPLGICDLVITWWKLLVLAVEDIGGWNCELIFISTPDVSVDTWVYDPTYGVAASSDITSPGSFLAPPMYVTFLCFFVLYFFRSF